MTYSQINHPKGGGFQTMELKLKYNADDSDRIIQTLEREWELAEQDYTKKKEAKGEKVDYFKMVSALNQRKKLKALTKLGLASVLSCGNILDNPEVNRTVEKLEREGLDSSNRLKPVVSSQQQK